MKRTAAPAGPLAYGIGNTPIGRNLVVYGPKGVCALRLVDVDGSYSQLESETHALQAVRRDCPGRELVRDDEAVAHVIEHVCRLLSGHKTNGSVKLDARGTPFQHQVWRAMRQAPAGKTWSYQELARRAGKPRAIRAVAQACARNPIAILVPCHRIISADGSLGGYFYGLDVKRRLLELEDPVG